MIDKRLLNSYETLEKFVVVVNSVLGNEGYLWEKSAERRKTTITKIKQD